MRYDSASPAAQPMSVFLRGPYCRRVFEMGNNRVAVLPARLATWLRLLLAAQPALQLRSSRSSRRNCVRAAAPMLALTQLSNYLTI